MDQVDNLQAGDIVIFIGMKVASGPADIMGLIVKDNRSPEDDPSVLVQFYGETDGYSGPVHYYHDELEGLLDYGAIRIINAS